MNTLDKTKVMHEYPFLKELLADDSKLQFVDCDEAFRSRHVLQVDDQRINGGWETWSLYVVRNDNLLQSIPMNFGKQIIYPAQNWHPETDYPDDVYEIGEMLGDALDRQDLSSVAFVVLHGRGHRGDGSIGPGMKSESFNTITVAAQQSKGSR